MTIKRPVIEGVLKDWGDRLHYGHVKGTKGRNITGGRSADKPAARKRASARKKLIATLRKAPEVMVKITGSGKDMRSIHAHMSYIARWGKTELEDEQGRIYIGKKDVLSLRDDWRGGGIPYQEGKRREAFNIILSMPPGTDRESVKNAARAFAAELFSGHQYVMAHHADTDHPHAHLLVRAIDRDGIRLNPRKADLQHWREVFAEKLGEYGIVANATPRRARGVTKKSVPQAVQHIDLGYAAGQRNAPARATAGQQTTAQREAESGKDTNPHRAAIIAQRRRVQHDFGVVARALATGDYNDKKLAVEVVKYVQAMPPIKTQRDELIEAIKAQQQEGPRQATTSKDKSKKGPMR